MVGHWFRKCPVESKTSSRRVVPVGDVDSALGIDGHIVGQLELARARSPRAPLEQVVPVVREFHHARCRVPVADIEIAIGREGHIGRQVEGVLTHAGHSLLAELQEHLPLRIHFVDHLAGGVDHPDVALRIDTHGVRAAGIASGRTVDSRVAGGAGNAIARSNRPDLALAEHAVAPGAHELPAALEFQDWVSAAMQDQDVALGVDGHTGSLDQIPCAGRARRVPRRVGQSGTSL